MKPGLLPNPLCSAAPKPCPAVRARASARAAWIGTLAAVWIGGTATAQDAVRGAQLYVQLPSVPSCVSCHGPDPSQGRNNLLIAADQPAALQQALNTVGAMGYLKPVLSEPDVRDLAAYLGRVSRQSASEGQVAVWPFTVEFGSLAVGSVSPVQTVAVRNLQATSIALDVPRVEGPGAPAVILETDCPRTLAPSSACDVRLRAQAGAVGSSAATLVLGPPTSVPGIVGLAFSARAGGVGVLSTDLAQPVLDFGSAAAGSRLPRSFRLLNQGSAAAVLGVMTVTGPGRTAFRIEAGEGGCAVGLSLAPGLACEMRLSFAAGIAGDFRATLQWRGDATQPASLALMGSVPVGESPAPPVAAPVTPAPGAEAPSGGGGCSAGPAVRRIDPMLALMVFIALAALSTRRWRKGWTARVTWLTRHGHGAFMRPAYRP